MGVFYLVSIKWLPSLQLLWQIPGEVTAAKGFKAAGMYGGLRAKGEKPELALVSCDVDATVAGEVSVFSDEQFYKLWTFRFEVMVIIYLSGRQVKPLELLAFDRQIIGIIKEIGLFCLRI